MAYVLPMFVRLGSPSASKDHESGTNGVRAVIVAPTRELASQIHNDCLKLAQGRKWRIVLYSKDFNDMAKGTRDKIGSSITTPFVSEVFLTPPFPQDVIISTPLRLVAALREGTIELHK